MRGMWKRWSHAFGAAALTVFGMIAAALLIMALPFVVPIMAWAEKRAVGSKRRIAERSPCSWCIAQLGEPALARADAIHVALCRHGGWRPRDVRAPDPDYRRVLSALRCRASTRCGVRPLRAARSGRVRVFLGSIHRHSGAAAHRTGSMSLAGAVLVRGSTLVDHFVESSECRSPTASASYEDQPSMGHEIHTPVCTTA